MIKKVQINKDKINVDLINQTADKITFKLGDAQHEFKLHSKSANSLILNDNENKLYHFTVADGVLQYSGDKYSFSKVSSFSEGKKNETLADSLAAPLPGKVISVKSKVKNKIKEGDILVVIEAMKMEHNILAYKDGVFSKLNVKVGDNIPEGFIIGEIE